MQKSRGYDPQTYKFEDLTPYIGKAYYRLNSTDFDGYQEDFGAKLVEFYGDQAVRIYPQPAADRVINIQLSFTTTDPTSIRVLDMSGLEIITYKTNDPVSSFCFDLNPGSYVVRVSSGNFQNIQRVIVR